MKNALSENLGIPGRMISYSKTSYREKNPDNFVVFNANICTKSEKVWYGDLDLTRDKNKLQKIATDLNEDLYVLYEMDARFENEKKFNIENAAAIFLKDGTAKVGKKYSQYYKL